MYDPFLGTGSLIIPPAYHGSYGMGSDIDLKALHGWGKLLRNLGFKGQFINLLKIPPGKSTKATEIEYQENQNISGNMESYSLSNRYLGCYSSDFSSGLLRNTPLFDVILTDPPYGIREASLKVNKDIKNSQFSLSEQFLELLNFAATHLVTGN